MGDRWTRSSVLTIVAQLRKLAGFVMIIHVKCSFALTFRRTRFEYGLVIWSVVASALKPTRDVRFAIAYTVGTAGEQ